MESNIRSGPRLIENRTILIGDVLEKIKEIPKKSVNVVITSPPYWGLRDYSVEGQWGLEPHFQDFLKKLNDLMNEIKRVLKDNGTVWINLGDTYSSKPIGKWNGGGELFKGRDMSGYNASGKIDKTNSGVKEKSRVAVPERFYINCIDNGWIARNHIPWIKENSMPQSIHDRFTNKWESVFFFAKQSKYYFNLDAVRERPNWFDSKPTKPKDRTGQQTLSDSKYEDESNAGRLGKYRNKNRKQDSTIGSNGKPKPNYEGFNERWEEQIRSGKYGKDEANRARVVAYQNTMKGGNPKGKNPGDVFKINPRPFPEAHFATFPIDLPLKILKCSCPKDGFVLDPFFGAGTVGVAAEMLGLNWIGIELKKEYTEIAVDRLEPYKNARLEEF